MDGTMTPPADKRTPRKRLLEMLGARKSELGELRSRFTTIQRKLDELPADRDEARNALSEVSHRVQSLESKRDEHVSFGCTLDAAPAADLVAAFLNHNRLPDPRPEWNKLTLLSHPPETL